MPADEAAKPPPNRPTKSGPSGISTSARKFCRRPGESTDLAATLDGQFSTSIDRALLSGIAVREAGPLELPGHAMTRLRLSAISSETPAPAGSETATTRRQAALVAKTLGGDTPQPWGRDLSVRLISMIYNRGVDLLSNSDSRAAAANATLRLDPRAKPPRICWPR